METRPEERVIYPDGGALLASEIEASMETRPEERVIMHKGAAFSSSASWLQWRRAPKSA